MQKGDASNVIYAVKHAVTDADYDIVLSACNTALQNAVLVVGDDTDLFVILQYHFSATTDQVMYLQTSSNVFTQSSNKRRVT